MAHLKKSAVTGHLLKNADGHLVKTCSVPVPSSCPEDVEDCYMVVDGPVTSVANELGEAPCSTPDDGTAYGDWDGTIPALVGFPCTWLHSTRYNWGGYLIYGASISRISSTPSNYWILRIYMIVTVPPFGEIGMVAFYYKYTGATPVGVYTANVGCVAPATLEVADCPP